MLLSMKTTTSFIGFLILILNSITGFSQIESTTTLKDFDYLHRNYSFIEEFNDQEIAFEKPKLLGLTADMMINSGQLKLEFTEKGDGLMFIAKSKPGILDKDAVEFEIKFKMPVKKLAFRLIAELGQKMVGQGILKLDLTPERVVCVQKTENGVALIKKPIRDLYNKEGDNTINLIRYNERVMLFLNGKMLGQSKYKHKDKDRGGYKYDPEKTSSIKHDMRIRFIHPFGAIDYIKIAELSEAPITSEQQNIQPEVKEQVAVVPVNETPKVTDNSRDSGFDFSKSAGSDTKKVEDKINVNINGKFYAIIIGNNEYQDATISTLDQPIKDATKLYNVLTTKYTFDKKNVLFLKNATRTNIIEAFDALSNNLTPNDNLLIFYAGHGYWNEKKETGYWLPVDAKKSNTANWLRNSTIQGYLDEIPAKHTLLIADACFGGGIFKTRKAFNDAPPSIESLYKLKSRKGITSGMLNEVPDRSVFMEYLTKRLTENNLKYISTLDVFTQFRVAVMNNSSNTPQYGTIHNTGDEGGDFIFIKRVK